MENEIKIKRAENGYIVTFNEYVNDGEEKQEFNHVIEKGEEIDEENDCLKNLLFFVAEQFGYNYDKWGEENLDINFNLKGHKID